eukprot:1373431-Rhodomonas_salina.5
MEPIRLQSCRVVHLNSHAGCFESGVLLRRRGDRTERQFSGALCATGEQTTNPSLSKRKISWILVLGNRA